jgi:hypothetical protein
MAQNSDKVIDRLILLFTELTEIMENNQENNWIRGVKGCLNTLKSQDYSNDKIKLNEVKSIYKTMYAGYGSFSDYSLWKDDYDERIKANKRLDKIRNEIWNILEKID